MEKQRKRLVHTVEVNELIFRADGGGSWIASWYPSARGGGDSEAASKSLETCRVKRPRLGQ